MTPRTPSPTNGGASPSGLPGRPPRFIALEGGEGSGKTTQASRLAARLGAVRTHEPGATPVGAALRSILLDPVTQSLSERAEALMMAADRAQHVADVVRPELAAGRHVVTDRYIGSSLAYQGYGRGLPLDEVRRLSVWATDGLWPDLTVLLDVTPEVAESRLARSNPDRMEGAGAEFHRRVLEGFRTLAASEPHPWVVVDGTAPPDDVEAAVWEAVTSHLPGLEKRR